MQSNADRLVDGWIDGLVVARIASFQKKGEKESKKAGRAMAGGRSSSSLRTQRRKKAKKQQRLVILSKCDSIGVTVETYEWRILSKKLVSCDVESGKI